MTMSSPPKAYLLFSTDSASLSDTTSEAELQITNRPDQLQKDSTSNDSGNSEWNSAPVASRKEHSGLSVSVLPDSSALLAHVQARQILQRLVLR